MRVLVVVILGSDPVGFGRRHVDVERFGISAKFFFLFLLVPAQQNLVDQVKEDGVVARVFFDVGLVHPHIISHCSDDLLQQGFDTLGALAVQLRFSGTNVSDGLVEAMHLEQDFVEGQLLRYFGH